MPRTLYDLDKRDIKGQIALNGKVLLPMELIEWFLLIKRNQTNSIHE
jgi:hypothetical protein